MTASKKKAVPESKAPTHSKTLALHCTPEDKNFKHAELITSPEFAALRSIIALEGNGGADAELDAMALHARLKLQSAAVNNGDLALGEAMLMNQAVAMQSLSTRLIERGMQQSQMPNLEGFMRLALRAQAQSARTLQILGELKNPTIFARQANIAHGPQQINNGAIAGAPATQNTPNKLLLEELPNERLDTRTQGPSIIADPAMATVEEVHRPEVASG